MIILFDSKVHMSYQVDSTQPFVLILFVGEIKTLKLIWDGDCYHALEYSILFD